MWTDFFEVLMPGCLMCLDICGYLHSEEPKPWKSLKGFGYIKGRLMCLNVSYIELNGPPKSSLEFDLVSFTLPQHATQKYLFLHWVNLGKYPSELNKF